MGLEQISTFQPEQGKEEEFKSYKKIISENTTEEKRQRFSVSIKNHLKKLFPEQEEVLSYMHPEIIETNKRLKEVGPNDLVKVNFIDRHGRTVEDQWVFYEYLRRIGFSGNKKKGNTPYDRYKEEVASSENIKNQLKEYHQESLQDRNERAYSYDKKLEARAKNNKIGRERQLTSQYKEDPYYCQMIEKAGYMHALELSLLHDYLDATDILLELDSGDKEPVYLAVQRTLQKKQGKIDKKKSKIDKHPIWFLPEFPERNPVLRFVLAEQVDEYFLSDGTARIDTEKATKEQGILKTLETLKEAKKMVEIHKERIKDIKEVDVRKRHEKYFARYEKAINSMMKKITEDEGVEELKVNDKILTQEIKNKDEKPSPQKLKEYLLIELKNNIDSFSDNEKEIISKYLYSEPQAPQEQKLRDKAIKNYWKKKYGLDINNKNERWKILNEKYGKKL